MLFRPHTAIDLYEILRDAVEITRPRWKNDAERRNIGIRIVLKCSDQPAPPVLGSEPRAGRCSYCHYDMPFDASEALHVSVVGSYMPPELIC